MKKFIIGISAVLILAVSGFRMFSPRTIQGIVRDASDHTPLAGVSVKVKDTKIATSTDKTGHYAIQLPDGKSTLVFSFIGFNAKEVKAGKSEKLDVRLDAAGKELREVVVVGYGAQKAKREAEGPVAEYMMSQDNAKVVQATPDFEQLPLNSESYSTLNENRFFSAKQRPLSTFGIDVDNASYSNIRRFINNNQVPPADAVRIEEMVNYFNYSYPQPENSDPFSVNTEISQAPWNINHKLVKIGLQGKRVATEKLPASNLVFLIDVSGSMASANKLPLVQASMRMLTDQLRDKDKVAIVVYAGAAGLVLPSTEGLSKQKIKDAINNLQAGGSTAGGAGIKLAYSIAQQNFIKGGNNRVILATDGDFNVGASGDDDMKHLIEEKRESGLFLTVLGYGMGNYKDSKMEILADKGNGNYAYIDNISEANKVLVKEFGGTLFTIAKDVKLQVEFNPAKVGSYRLIAYENRMLRKEDFNNDKKDAGDLGSGHTVTALYEIIPVGVKSQFSDSVDPLKYQEEQPSKINKANSQGDELFTVKLRYKKPDEDISKLIEKPVIDRNVPWNRASVDFRFAAAVAGYGMLLRKSEFRQDTNFERVIEWAKGALGEDQEGYRAEFLRLVKSSSLMEKDLLTSTGRK